MYTDASPASGRTEAGFTLIELLTVMMILGVLAAISVPVYVGQRARAHDTSARADTRRLGQSIVAWYADHADSTPPAVAISGDRYLLDGNDVGPVGDGVRLGTNAPTPVATTTADTSAWTPTTWCVNVLHPDGTQSVFSFSATEGLRNGACP